MATKDKSIWILILFIFAGLVLGYGQEFGLQNPFVLNLSVLTVTFALMIKINIASIIGMFLAIFIYKKVM